MQHYSTDFVVNSTGVTTVWQSQICDKFCAALSLHFNGHFPDGCGLASTRTSPLLLLLGAQNDGGGGDGWSYKTFKAPNHHHQQTNTQLFTGRMSFLLPMETDSVGAVKEVNLVGASLLWENIEMRGLCVYFTNQWQSGGLGSAWWRGWPWGRRQNNVHAPGRTSGPSSATLPSRRGSQTDDQSWTCMLACNVHTSPSVTLLHTHHQHYCCHGGGVMTDYR